MVARSVEGERGGAFPAEFQIGAHHLLLAQELGQGQHDVGGGDARLRTPGQFDANDVGQAHPRRAPQHHVLRFQATDADRDHAQRIDVRGVAVRAHAGIREGHAATHLDHRRHLLQVDLVHDAVARRDDVDVLERMPRPLDEVEAILVASILDGAVLGKRVRIVAAAFHRQRVIHDQLHRHHRIDLGRIPALVGDGVTQAGQIHQCGLAEDVVADHPRGEPRKIQIAATFDQLPERIDQGRRLAAAHQVFRQHARGVRQPVVGAGRDRFDRGARVEVVQGSARQGFAVFGVHGFAVGVALRRSGFRIIDGDSARSRPETRGARGINAGRSGRTPGSRGRCNWRWGG